MLCEDAGICSPPLSEEFTLGCCNPLPTTYKLCYPFAPIQDPLGSSDASPHSSKPPLAQPQTWSGPDLSQREAGQLFFTEKQSSISSGQSLTERQVSLSFAENPQHIHRSHKQTGDWVGVIQGLQVGTETMEREGEGKERERDTMREREK